MSHPALNIHKAFFEIGKAFRVTGVYGLFLSLTHTRLPTLLSLSDKLLEPIAMAYLLCIMGCSVPEDWFGWEARPEERRKWRRSRVLLSQDCCSGPKVPQASVVMTVCVCVFMHEVVVTGGSQAEIEGYSERTENQTKCRTHQTLHHPSLPQLIIHH